LARLCLWTPRARLRARAAAAAVQHAWRTRCTLHLHTRPARARTHTHTHTHTLARARPRPRKSTRRGRKRAALLYVATYALSCATKHSGDYWVLMLGRLLGGVATSLLFSAFESWAVAAHNAAGAWPEGRWGAVTARAGPRAALWGRRVVCACAAPKQRHARARAL
jgi:hypothetical protein